MKKPRLLILLIVMMGIALGSICVRNADAIGETFSGSSSYTITRDDTLTFTDLQINGVGNETLAINLFVPYGTLELVEHSGVTFNGPSSGKNLNVTGTRLNLNAALATLRFTPSYNIGEQQNVRLQITIGGYSNTMYSPETQHLYRAYRLVNDSLVWSSAKTAAEADSVNGFTGYLATIGSAGEQDTVGSLKLGGWLGATDSSEEGVWNWVSGPEPAQNFWNGGADGAAVDDAYVNWQVSMPDNYTGSNPAGENCLEIYSGFISKWNDQDCDGGVVSSYVVEYGDAENTFDLTYKNIDINITNGRDLNKDGREDVLQSNVKDFMTPEGKWVSIALNGQCTFLTAQLVTEDSLDNQDAIYDYPGNLLDFTASCGGGAQTSVRIMYYDDMAEVLRKYNPITHQYTDMNGEASEDFVGKSNTDFNGQNYTTVQYVLRDGGDFDTDGLANGQFSDPIGVAVLAPPANSSNEEELITPIVTSSSDDQLADTGLNVGIPMFCGVLFVCIASGSMLLKASKGHVG